MERYSSAPLYGTVLVCPLVWNGTRLLCYVIVSVLNTTAHQLTQKTLQIPTRCIKGPQSPHSGILTYPGDPLETRDHSLQAQTGYLPKYGFPPARAFPISTFKTSPHAVWMYICDLVDILHSPARI